MSDQDDFRAVRKLEEELRGLAPEPEFEFLVGLERSLRPPAPTPRRAGSRLRLPVALGLTGLLAVGIAATGGLSYAASSVVGISKIVHRASAPQQAIVVRGLSAGGDQYQPGYGFGDPSHNHDGPPVLAAVADDGKPVADATPIPAAPAPGGLAKTVEAAVNFDEQVHLWISVIDPRGTPLLLTQRSKRGGSRVGNRLTGPQTKFIQYAVLVPRTIPMQLRVPANLLRPGTVYRIRIVAVDPQGNKSRIFVPFSQ